MRRPWTRTIRRGSTVGESKMSKVQKKKKSTAFRCTHVTVAVFIGLSRVLKSISMTMAREKFLIENKKRGVKESIIIIIPSNIISLFHANHFFIFFFAFFPKIILDVRHSFKLHQLKIRENLLFKIT